MRTDAIPMGMEKLLQRELLICPCCGNKLFRDNRSLRCIKNHNFDIARQGYVNLFQNSKKNESPEATYSAEFVQARAEAISRGFFVEVVRQISSILQAIETKKSLCLLDAGAGEGSFLNELVNYFSSNPKQEICATGIDLAVPGIRQASARFPSCAWCVADLSCIPVPNHVFDVVLNVLSPANYLEFSRVLKADGILIKVVPQANHLAEIRSALHASQEFSNARVVEHFGSSVSLVKSYSVNSCIPCGVEGAPKLFAMTPLSWHATPEQREKFIANAPAQLTVAFDILVGKPKPLETT